MPRFIWVVLNVNIPNNDTTVVSAAVVADREPKQLI